MSSAGLVNGSSRRLPLPCYHPTIIPPGGSGGFGCIVDWWCGAVEDTGVKLYVGHGVYRVNEEGWEPDEIPNQVKACMEAKNCDGSVFFGYPNIKKNAVGIIEKLAELNK